MMTIIIRISKESLSCKVNFMCSVSEEMCRLFEEANKPLMENKNFKHKRENTPDKLVSVCLLHLAFFSV